MLGARRFRCDPPCARCANCVRSTRYLYIRPATLLSEPSSDSQSLHIYVYQYVDVTMCIYAQGSTTDVDANKIQATIRHLDYKASAALRKPANDLIKMAAEAFVLGVVDTADEDEDDSAGMAADLWEEREVREPRCTPHTTILSYTLITPSTLPAPTPKRW